MSELLADEYGVMRDFTIVKDPDGAAIVLQQENDTSVIVGEFLELLDAEEAYAKAYQEAKSSANAIAMIALEARMASDA